MFVRATDTENLSLKIVRGCAGRPVCCLKRLLRWPLRARAGRCRGSVSLSRAAICVTHGGFCHLSIGSTFSAHLPGKGRLGAGAGAGAGARSAAARRAQQRVGWGRRRGGGGGGGGGGSARAARATEGRSSDRASGRCSVCDRSALCRRARASGQGACVAARDARRRRRAAERSVSGEAAGRGRGG